LGIINYMLIVLINIVAINQKKFYKLIKLKIFINQKVNFNGKL